MAKKKQSLLDSLNKINNPSPKEEKKRITTAQKEPEKEISSNVPETRRGKKTITTFVFPEVLKQLKLLGIEKEMTNQELMYEALNELFKKYNKKPIA
jgi:hypothetical protein